MYSIRGLKNKKKLMDEDAEYCLQFCYVIQYSESELQIHYY